MPNSRFPLPRSEAVAPSHNQTSPSGRGEQPKARTVNPLEPRDSHPGRPHADPDRGSLPPPAVQPAVHLGLWRPLRLRLSQPAICDGENLEVGRRGDFGRKATDAHCKASDGQSTGVHFYRKILLGMECPQDFEESNAWHLAGSILQHEGLDAGNNLVGLYENTGLTGVKPHHVVAALLAGWTTGKLLDHADKSEALDGEFHGNACI